MESKGALIGVKNAQKMHEFLVENEFLAGNLRPIKLQDCVIFPLSQKGIKNSKKIKEKFKTAQVNDSQFEPRDEKPRNIKEAVAAKLSDKEMALVPTSFDTLGDVAILELEAELVPKAKVIAQALMQVNSSIKSVFLKTGAHQGIFRSEPVKLITGEKITRATYRENGCVFKITLGEVFFSPRLSTERKRICSLIKKGEHVAALFAGVGPFPIIFAKHSKLEKTLAIELNPIAVADMQENIILNHVESRVEAVLGDVKALSKKYANKFDRAVMPLPKGGEDFLEDAINYIKTSGGVVHYYQFSDRENPFEVPLRQIESACKKLGRKHKILVKRKVREFSPQTIQVVIDFKIWK